MIPSPPRHACGQLLGELDRAAQATAITFNTTRLLGSVGVATSRCRPAPPPPAELSSHRPPRPTPERAGCLPARRSYADNPCTAAIRGSTGLIGCSGEERTRVSAPLCLIAAVFGKTEPCHAGPGPVVAWRRQSLQEESNEIRHKAPPL